MSLRCEKVPHGFLLYDGDKKVAEIHATSACTDINKMTSQEAVAHRGPSGAVIRKPMVTSDWTINLCSPSNKVDLLKEIVAAIPAEYPTDLEKAA